MRTAMILAAGRGKRMRHLTDHLPKPLIPLNGKPIIVHTIERLVKAGVEKIVINLKFRGEQIQEALGDGSTWGVSIVYSEELLAWGTGGGIVHALPLLGNEPFLVTAGDIYTDYPFARLYELEQSALAHVVLVPNPVWHAEGDFSLAADSYLIDGNDWTFGSFAVFKPEFFNGFRSGRFPLGAVLSRAIRYRHATGEVYSGTWFNIGDPELLAEAETFLQQNNLCEA